MRLNLSDAVDDLVPITPPPCFFNRSSWSLYLKSAAASQNHKGSQKVIIIGADGEPMFNERLNYCADCTQAKSLQMLNKGRCDPYHLSDDPEPPPADGWQRIIKAATSTPRSPRLTTQSPRADVTPAHTYPHQDAFTRLVTQLLAHRWSVELAEC